MLLCDGVLWDPRSPSQVQAVKRRRRRRGGRAGGKGGRASGARREEEEEDQEENEERMERERTENRRGLVSSTNLIDSLITVEALSTQLALKSSSAQVVSCCMLMNKADHDVDEEMVEIMEMEMVV
eukprot:753360-Hanusia_phi.AAC.1